MTLHCIQIRGCLELWRSLFHKERSSGSRAYNKTWLPPKLQGYSVVNHQLNSFYVFFFVTFEPNSCYTVII